MKLKELLKNAKSIAIAGHVRPDGDCVGSVLGVYHYLKKICEKADICAYLDKPSEQFSILKGVELLCQDVSEDKVYDVFIALDSGDKERLGAAVKYFDTAIQTVCIDHHISNKGYGDINYVVADASSTCELVFNTMDEELIDVDIAACIYTGIVHDTGVFQYSCTSANTILIVGKLMAYGIPFTKIIGTTYYQKTYVQNQILGRALLESILFLNGQCIVSAIDKKTMDFYNVTSNDMDGIVNQIGNTKGVECAIFMYEIALQEYKVSMRSKEIVDVAAIASYFGGGGHVRAAGCNMKGTIHDTINNLSLHIEKQLIKDRQQENDLCTTEL